LQLQGKHQQKLDKGRYGKLQVTMNKSLGVETTTVANNVQAGVGTLRLQLMNY
jgi:hypothetical protein